MRKTRRLGVSTGFLICVLMVSSVSSLATETWHYEVVGIEKAAAEREDWQIHDGRIWKCGPRWGPVIDWCGWFPNTSTDGLYITYVLEDDPSEPDYTEITIRMIATVFDASWRSWLPGSETTDDKAAFALDLFASLGTVAIWLQPEWGDCWQTPEPVLLYDRGECSEWRLSDWSGHVVTFGHGALFLAPLDTTEIEGSFMLYIENYGCDSWNDGGIVCEGRVAFRCWRE